MNDIINIQPPVCIRMISHILKPSKEPKQKTKRGKEATIYPNHLTPLPSQSIWQLLDVSIVAKNDSKNIVESSASKEKSKKHRTNHITNISTWAECFCAYITVLLKQVPSRTQDLLAYMSLITHAARQYKGSGELT